MVPGISSKERGGLLRICAALCAWIESAELPDRSAARTFYALFDERHDERRAVVDACGAARREVEGGPYVELLEAIEALASVEYEHGIDPVEAAARTAEGDERVGECGARLQRAQGAWTESLGGGASPVERRALEDVRLGLEQLAVREPYHAWISLDGAIRSLRGGAPDEPAGGAREREDAEADIPDGCERCFRNPDVLEGLSGEVHNRVATLVDDSHLGVHLAECVHCGQASVQIFEEEIDWHEGDDAQRYDVIAITDRDAELLRAAGEADAHALAKSLVPFRARLWWNWPTGGTKTTGRTAKRYCERCGRHVLARRRSEGGNLLLAAVTLGMAGRADHVWRCLTCGGRTQPARR